MRYNPPVVIPGWDPGVVDDGELTDEELYSILVREPFHLRLHEIAALDRYQIYHIYLRPYKDGELIRGKYSGAIVPFSHMYRQVWSERGKTNEEINSMIAADAALTAAIARGDA